MIRATLLGMSLYEVEGVGEDAVEVEESRVKVKTSPSEERAAKVFPHEVTLLIFGFEDTCLRDMSSSSMCGKRRGEANLGGPVSLHFAGKSGQRENNFETAIVIQHNDFKIEQRGRQLSKQSPIE